MTLRANRLAIRFAALSDEARAGLGIYLTGGDPDLYSFNRMLQALPGAGADLIEVGMPAREPVMDGPLIRRAHARASRAGITLGAVLASISDFRAQDPDTPVVLMGYRETVDPAGIEAFVASAAVSGVDGILVVDLTDDEQQTLGVIAAERGVAAIRFVPPDADRDWMTAQLSAARGFVYAVASEGKTGSKPLGQKTLAKRMETIRTQARLPVATGFGIRTPRMAAAFGRIADAVFVGSALAQVVEGNLASDPAGHVIAEVGRFSAALADPE